MSGVVRLVHRSCASLRGNVNEHLFQILIPVTGLVSGLIATYVSLQNRALLAEVA